MFPQLLTFFAAVIGFLGCWKIYHYLKNEVLEDMIKKAERSSKPTEIRRTLKMFVLVAGGSPIYQIACSITVILFFIYLHLYYIFPQW